MDLFSTFGALNVKHSFWRVVGGDTPDDGAIFGMMGCWSTPSNGKSHGIPVVAGAKKQGMYPLDPSGKLT